MLHQRVEEDVACAGHTAADEEHLGVGGAGNGGQSHAEGVGHLVHLAGSEGVAAAGGIKDVLGLEVLAAQDAVCVGVLVQQLLHAADDAGSAGILLEAAVLAAAAGGRLVRVDGDVADLAAGTVCAVDDFAVDDDAAADAGAQRDHDCAAAALGRTHPDLTQSSHVGVVAHQHLHAVQQAGQLGRDVPFAPAAKVGADDGDDAAVQHGAGDADADALHLLGGDLLLGHLGVDGVGQILEDALTGVGGVGGDFPLFQQSARGGEQSDLGRGAAEVDAECVFFHNSFTPFLRRSPAGYHLTSV